MLLAPLTKLLDLNFAFNFAFVLARPVIGALAFGALKLDQIWLRHIYCFYVIIIT